MKWSASIGDNTSILVSKLFDRYKVEEQAYKGCMSLLKLSDKYGKPDWKMRVNWRWITSVSLAIKILR